jgi:hypothetical protein
MSHGSSLPKYTRPLVCLVAVFSDGGGAMLTAPDAVVTAVRLLIGGLENSICAAVARVVNANISVAKMLFILVLCG